MEDGWRGEGRGGQASRGKRDRSASPQQAEGACQRVQDAKPAVNGQLCASPALDQIMQRRLADEQVAAMPSPLAVCRTLSLSASDGECSFCGGYEEEMDIAHTEVESAPRKVW